MAMGEGGESDMENGGGSRGGAGPGAGPSSSAPAGSPRAKAGAGLAGEPLLAKFLVDLCCLLAVWIPVLVLFVAGHPYRRGFFCDDESVRHPFKESTVPNWLLYLLGGGLPNLAILLTEAVQWRAARRRRQSVARHTFFQRRVHPYLWECYHLIGVFGFGAGCSQLVTDIAKYSIGRLRPHFYYVCLPDVDCDAHKWEYIVNFTCKGTDVERIHDARLSFPSGHSSFSFYTMVFLAMYLQARITWRGSWLLRPLLQTLCICLAWGTALSRVSDYKHHWSDVLSGAVLGASVAVLVVLYVSRMFRPGAVALGVPHAGPTGSLTSTDGLLAAGLPLHHQHHYHRESSSSPSPAAAALHPVGYQSIQSTSK